MLFVRFCSALLSAYVFVSLAPDPGTLLSRFSSCGGECWGESYEENLVWYGKLVAAFKLLGGCLWLAAWALLEVRAWRQPVRKRSRLLTHLRYGPLAVLLLSCAAVVISDAMLIQYSRWQIVRYIHGDASPHAQPEFKLHNNYRGWCGNAFFAQEYALYGETPAAYFDDPDPAVRARALRASVQVYDWANEPGDGPSMEVLRRAVNDPDPLVRSIALEALRP